MTVGRLFRPEPGQGFVVDVTPAVANWRFLSFKLVRLDVQHPVEIHSDHEELALVPLHGACDVIVEGRPYRLTRSDVFEERGSLLYVPPGREVVLETTSECSLAIGGAPASDAYPVRFMAGVDSVVELRGGGTAFRQIGHLLAPRVGAHRLIVYEVYVPRGTWSGWPPHCHDGHDGSPYLEETYFFRLQPRDGFAIHRNYREASALDEVFIAHDEETVLVAAGYHTTVACPGSNMYFLNFLAGDLEHQARDTPPCFEDRYRWIEGKWDAGAMALPTAGANKTPSKGLRAIS